MKCTCSNNKIGTNEWQDRLQFSDLDPITIQHIVNLENEAIHLLEVTVDESLEALLDEYEKKGSLNLNDLIGGVDKHYGLISDEIEKPLNLYYRGLVNSSREHAYKSIGFEREARKKLIRKKAAIGGSDEAYENAVERAFTKVRTVGKDVIEELKDRWVANNGPTDVVKSFLLDEEENLRNEPLTRTELSERLRQLWIEKRYILQRIIRTETVNTSATVQLEEWFAQGFTEVERWEINDLRTCVLCRTLAQPGSNIYQIGELLKEEYPVTYCSHPQCRGGYVLRVNMSVFDDFESRLEEFANAQDIEVEDSKAENVPIEYQEQVEKALSDFGPDYGIKFVPEITESKEWIEDRVKYWSDFYSERDARARVDLEKIEDRGTLTQYTTTDGQVLISGDAGELNRITIPVLREKARQIYLTMDASDRNWVIAKYNKRQKETTMTLEKGGVQIIGGTPFITTLAGNSSEDYFMESYANYVADPARLFYMDKEMYDFLKDKFMAREYLMQGGVK